MAQIPSALQKVGMAGGALWSIGAVTLAVTGAWLLSGRTGTRTKRAHAEKRPPRPEPIDKRDRGDDETPETPPTEPEPLPLEEPPDAPGSRGPYVVD